MAVSFQCMTKSTTIRKNKIKTSYDKRWSREIDHSMGEDVSNVITNQRLMSKIYEELQITMTDASLEKWWGNLNRHFTKKGNWKTNKTSGMMLAIVSNYGWDLEYQGKIDLIQI